MMGAMRGPKTVVCEGKGVVSGCVDGKGARETDSHKNPHASPTLPRFIVNIRNNPRHQRNRRTSKDARKQSENDKGNPMRSQCTRQRKQSKHGKRPDTQSPAPILLA